MLIYPYIEVLMKMNKFIIVLLLLSLSCILMADPTRDPLLVSLDNEFLDSEVTFAPIAAWESAGSNAIINPESDLRADFLLKNPGKDYEQYKIKLGNLTLLQKPLNIVASNNFYALKTPLYKDCGIYFTRSLVEMPTIGNQSSVNRINQFLKVFPEWNAATIEERQQLLINLALEVWKI